MLGLFDGTGTARRVFKKHHELLSGASYLMNIDEAILAAVAIVESEAVFDLRPLLVRTKNQEVNLGAFQLPREACTPLKMKNVAALQKELERGANSEIYCFLWYVSSRPLLLKALRERHLATFALHYGSIQSKEKDYPKKLEKFYRAYSKVLNSAKVATQCDHV
jgi:hypothetical protein